MWGWLLLIAALLALGPPAANAASLGISPVRVELAPGQATAALTLRNAGDTPVLVQARAVAWSQKDGQDVYDATDDVIVSPPIFTVPAEGSQVVRVGLRRAPDAQRELSYRLFLQEVPPPPKPGQPGVQMALRIGLPIFVAPLQAPTPRLVWRATREGAGAGDLRVLADNPGAMHVQVLGFRLVGTGDKPQELARSADAAYLLPGQRHEWRVKSEAALPAGAKLSVQAQTDGGDLSGELTVDP